jgi:hypothetical protein
MATIVDTLFGVSPERLDRERAAAADARALAFAQLDPFQQANFAIGRGASSLAGAIGGALGGQDPELQRVTRRQQVAGQIDYTNLASIRQAMEMLPDDPVAVQQLSDVYRQVQESAAKVTKDEAAAKASAASAVREKAPPTTAELTNARAIAALAGPEGSPEYNAAFNAEYTRLTAKDGVDPIQKLILSGNYTPASVAVYERTKNVSDLKPVDKRAVTNVNVSNTAENEYAKKVGTATATADLNIIDSAQAVASTLPKMYETLRLIETGALNTGFAAELQQVVDRAKTKLLSDKAAGKRVTDTEYLDALLGSDVFPQISALGIGARGLDTPAEREFLRQVITGTISLDRETLKRMTDFRIKSAERAVEGYNKKLTAGELNQYQKITGRTLSPIAVTPRPVSGQGDGTPGNPIKLR